MNQFVTTQNNIGDMTIEAGVIIDVTAATTGVFPIAPGTSDGAPADMGTSATRSAPRFAGGSSRNMIIPQPATAAIPGGWMIQNALNKWISEDEQFTVRIGEDAKVEWLDEYDSVVMTAPAGSIPVPNRFACASSAYSGGPGGGEFIIDLGSDTGLVTLEFYAYEVPDIFKIVYDGVEVVNTGYRGVDGTYDGVPVVVSGPGLGTASFTKATASPTFCKVIVVAPFTGTAWDFTCGCPDDGSPPYTMASYGRSTFTASSIDGGASFTREVTFEGGERSTDIQLTSDAMGLEEFEMNERNAAQWTDGQLFSVNISDDGTANLFEPGGIIAIRALENHVDPSGSYEATEYGRNKYNNGVEFSASVTMVITSPIELYTYLELELAAGSVTSVKGPYSAPTLPANTSTMKVIPVSYSDGVGRVTQYQEGALLWK
jgi:hypothetical protein